MLQSFVAATNGDETATDRGSRGRIARYVRDTLPDLCWRLALVRATDHIVSHDSIVYELRERDGEHHSSRVIEICVCEPTEEIASVVDGGKGHSNAGKWEGLCSIPLPVFTAVDLDGAQANVMLLVEHNTTASSHGGAVGNDSREEPGGGHGGNGLVAMCDILVVDVDVIGQRVWN